MSSMLVCDVCGKPLDKPFYKLRILKADEGSESRDYKTVGAVDMHEGCVKLFKDWMAENRKKEQAK